MIEHSTITVTVFDPLLVKAVCINFENKNKITSSMKIKWFGVEEKCLLRSKIASVKQLYNYCEIFQPFGGK